MNVHQVGNAGALPFATGKSQPHGAAANKPDRSEPPDQSGPCEPLLVDPGPGNQAETESDKGVLRLLQEGHFKGVADVRLRINFFDELSAKADADALLGVGPQSESLVAAVNAELDVFIDTLAPDEETREAIDGAREEFQSAVQAAADEMIASDTLDRQSLADAIQSAFEQLVDQLQESLALVIGEDEAQVDTMDSVDETEGNAAETGATGTEEVPSDGPPDAADEPAEDEEDRAPAFEEALASLRSVFDEALAGLLEAIEAATRLPDPSPPPGNGAAYDKFLAIYDEMRGIAETDEPPPEEAIDSTA